MILEISVIFLIVVGVFKALEPDKLKCPYRETICFKTWKEIKEVQRG